MPSPFPGMDPYLEGYLWPDFHHRLATEISRRLTPRLRPRYVARLEFSVVQDSPPDTEISIMYPDVEVALAQGSRLAEAVAEYHILAVDTPEVADQPVDVIPPAPLTLPLLEPVEVRQVTIEVRDVGHNELITCIEILSPINKREPGLTKYRHKRARLRQAGVHLLEIDLLRRGLRPIQHPALPVTPYLITLTRAYAAQVEAWPIQLADPLPVLPVPLRDPDPVVPLALGLALTAIYDEAAYDLSIDYSQPPPPPPLTPVETSWLQEKLATISQEKLP